MEFEIEDILLPFLAVEDGLQRCSRKPRADFFPVTCQVIVGKC